MKRFRIFLSSPGDVVSDRAEARKLLLGLERTPLLYGRVHMDVVSWDDEYGGATMDAQLTPQQAVDRSLPTPAECDLTVVLLWNRMGTPLTETRPDGSQYLSGTEWEFDNAINANKPVLVYRCTTKAQVDLDDPEIQEKLTQKTRVAAFFKRLEAEGRAYASYGATDDLPKRLRVDVERHLNELLRDVDGSDARGEERVGPGRSAAIAAGPPEVSVAYRDWVKKQHGGVDLLGLQLKKVRPLSLSAIYVPQTTAPVRASTLELNAGEPFAERLVLAWLGSESLYVSGAPGTGKSTFCRWVAWLVAEGAIPSLDVPAPREFAEVLDDGLKGRLPVLLRLREFWEYLPTRLDARLTVSDVEDAIAAWVENRRPDGLDAALFRAHLAHGSALLILDGVDEVPVSAQSGAGKWLPRQQLLSALGDACPAWLQAGNRLLLTSRPYGLSHDDAERTTLGIAPLRPLPGALQRLLAYRWFAVLSASPQTGAEIAQDLFANIGSQPWLVKLASNPLLLTAMCIVFDEGKRLPQDKHELYERVVATVLFSRYQDPADIDRVKRELGVIAYGMHTADGRTTATAEATFYEIERWLAEYQERKGYTDRSEAGVYDTREALLSHSGLLVGSGDERAGFAHLSFQEFLAARRAFTVQEERLVELYLERSAIPEWRNTLSFLFGRLLAASSEPRKALDLLQTCIERAGAGDSQLLQVLSDAALVLTGKGITLPAEPLRRLESLLLQAMNGSAAITTRAEAGTALGWLGDPRFRADRWWLPDEDLLGFIRIEAGAFLMGSDPETDPDSDEDERPQHLVTLPEYYVARYPVTVAQFCAFAEDARLPVGDWDWFRERPNHPIGGVSFYEALAYCLWLTAKLRASEATPPLLRDLFAEGAVITLPSEAEWEKAARGQDGRIYPWGDDGFSIAHVNGDQITGSGTSTVGLFPDGVSPCGAVDMSGNVEEWTRSLWGPNWSESSGSYPYDTNDPTREDLQAPDDFYRTIRGGSFLSDMKALRVAARQGYRPKSANGYLGFRLVISRLRPQPLRRASS